MKILFDNNVLGGELFVVPPDERVREYVEALITLGFEPRVEMT